MTGVSIGDGQVTVAATLVAKGFGLDEQRLRELMHAGVITTICETGEGSDAGRTRLNFFYGNRALRLTVDAEGELVEPAQIDFVRSVKSRDRRHGPDAATE
ncbi:DUF6522 family protein [Pseudooceanicola sp.]|uniref:DUF6522 family protein n=1 Tax=Pseudooceanicola sp. TaxID=1914328 RepID=UPI00260CBF70|nr:DUF6522 family protein [Pseudooceanicola sp.]MDF1855860.1 DUF6522 family protein [Pseudooceanicola sp.]